VDVGAALTRVCWAVRALSFVNVRYDTAKNWRISSNISGHTRPIFAIFSPYESTLRADDGSVPYSPMRQGMLPWRPNNFDRNEKVMKADLYHLHSLHQH